MECSNSPFPSLQLPPSKICMVITSTVGGPLKIVYSSRSSTKNDATSLSDCTYQMTAILDKRPALFWALHRLDFSLKVLMMRSTDASLRESFFKISCGVLCCVVLDGERRAVGGRRGV